MLFWALKFMNILNFRNDLKHRFPSNTTQATPTHPGKVRGERPPRNRRAPDRRNRMGRGGGGRGRRGPDGARPFLRDPTRQVATGPRALANPQSFWKCEWSQWEAALQLLDTEVAGQVSVVCQRWNGVVVGGGTAAPSHTSVWKFAGSRRGLAGGRADGGRDGSAGQLGRWVGWGRAARGRLWSQPVLGCLSGCGPHIIMGRGTHFQCRPRGAPWTY